MTELKPATRALLALAREADDPSTAERAHNQRRLGRRLAALGVTASALAQSPALSAAALGAKGATSVSLGKVLLTWFAVGAAVGGVAQATAVVLGPGSPPALASDAVSTPPSPSSRALDQGVAHGSGVTPAAPTVPEGRDAPSEDGAVRAPLREPRDPSPGTPAVGSSSTLRPERASLAWAGAPPPVHPVEAERFAPDLSEVLDVLARAQTELAAHRAAGALAELDGYAARAPHGPMEEERRAMRTVTLCQLGQSRGFEDARQFLAQNASSPLATRVRAACRR